MRKTHGSMRDRSALYQRLVKAEERISSMQHQIAQQRKLVAELERTGRSASHAKYLLAGLELLQAARRDSRDRILSQLKPKHDDTPISRAYLHR
jgi:hypothetical protein